MKRKISAEIIADSKNKQGNRVTTFVLTFPRYILAELNTHRLFSKNSASSRAIPFKKMLKSVMEDPFTPIAWQREHKGMQGTEYLDETESKYAKMAWLEGRDRAISSAQHLSNCDVTKQLTNRQLEAYLWHKVILTSTEFENFFVQRCPQYTFIDEELGLNETYRSKLDAIEGGVQPETGDSYLDWAKLNKGQGEIHIMELAECMWDAMNESEPKLLEAGEWHIPFGDRIDEDKVVQACIDAGPKSCGYISQSSIENAITIRRAKVKIATARVARVSYDNFDGKEDYEADIKLYDRLSSMKHFSPFEHVCRAMNELEYGGHIKSFVNKNGIPTIESGWCRNFRGFIQLRNEVGG